MDGLVVKRIRELTTLQVDARTELEGILEQFGVPIDDTNNEWKIVKKFVKDNADFDSAVDFLMGGDRNPWDEKGSTLEQAIFWGDDDSEKGEHAIP
jgi:hypothetical protein